MTFIVTLIALAIERFFDWSHMRRFNGYIAYQRFIAMKLPGFSPYLLLVVYLVPIVFIIGLISLLLNGYLYGLLKLIFSLLVLLYCLGPKNLWGYGYSLRVPQGSENAPTNAGANINTTQNDKPMHETLIRHIFIEGNNRVFAVIFWFVLLGPIGALLYRLTIILHTELSEHHLPVVQESDTLLRALDYLPIRLLTFFFALGGHFTKVFSYWSKHVAQSWFHNETLLTEAGLLAIAYDPLNKTPEDGSGQKDAIYLLDRSFVIFLIIIAILELLI